MRILIAIIAAGLFAAANAQAEMPITYVGHPEIHRFDGSVRQVTLVQPVCDSVEPDSEEPAHGLDPTGERSSERLIETGVFLKEPLSTEATIHGSLLFHDEPISLDNAPNIENGTQSTNGGDLEGDDTDDGDRPTGSPFHGMHLAQN